MTNATISFVTSTGGSKLIILPDADRNIDTYGKPKTSFAYGETAYFRVYAEYPENTAVFASDGTLTPLGLFTENAADEPVVFLKSNTADTKKPVLTLLGCEWMGNSLGNITKKSTFSVQCETEPKPSQGVFGTALLNYRSSYALFGLTLPVRSRDSYPVIVYAEAVNG